MTHGQIAGIVLSDRMWITTGGVGLREGIEMGNLEDPQRVGLHM